MHILLTGEALPVNSTVTPILVTSDKQESFNIDDLYTKGATSGRYVARVNDVVNDYETGQYWVTSVDDEYIATLEPWPSQSTGDESGTLEALIGRQRTQEAYGIYIDTNVYPYRLVVDNSLFIGGSNFERCKIFKGADVTEAGGIVVSKWIEANEVVDDSFPLELAAIDGTSNYSVKVVKPGWTNYKLEPGEIVTAVFYGDDSAGERIIPLRVFASSVVRDSSVGQDLITGISIESPFLDDTINTQLNIPLNVTVDTIDKVGVVHYQSGKKVTMPIDGTKFSLFGESLVLATTPGERFPLTLKYSLSAQEYTNSAIANNDKNMRASYSMVTTNNVKSYSVKLYAVPKWNDTYYRYELRWFLYSLDRATHVEVTHLVYNGGVNSPAFDGDNYGELQELFVAVNLQDVFEDYPDYKHVQNFSIQLNGPYNSTSIPFSYTYNGDVVNRYGSVGKAKIHYAADNPYLRIGEGFDYEWDWLAALYWRLNPMYDANLEDTAPTPTHFRIKTQSGDLVGEFKVSDYAKALPIETVPTSIDTLQIDFIIKGAESDVELTTAAIAHEYVGVPSSPIIAVQPETDVYAQVNEAYTIKVEVEYSGILTYQWRWMNANGTEEGFDVADNKSSIIKFVDSEADEGKRWYCEITDEQGESITSTVATVHVLT